MKLSHIVGTLLLALGPAGLAQAEDSLADKVRKAVDQGINFLCAQEKQKGNWEACVGLHAKGQQGGSTALATVALLKAGIPPEDERIQRCLKYLRTLPPAKSYTVGLQTMAFCLAGQKQDRERIQRNLEWIEKTRLPGGWGYDEKIRSPDHSINQYVLLGLHEARLAGFKIDRDMLKFTYRIYHKEGHSGEWSYRSQATSLTMTAAGLCNLLILSDGLRENRQLRADGSDPNCGRYAEEPTTARALAFLGRNFPDDIRTVPRFPHAHYCLHGLERAGRLTGRRFFGEHDWYRVGCEYLVEKQKADGSWEGKSTDFDRWPVVSTSLALLFLIEGRTPVLVGKFAHGEAVCVHERTDGAEEWNRKRNDARYVVEFCSRELFDRKPLAWQVFDARRIDRTEKKLSEELKGIPVVYLNGHDLTRMIDTRFEEILRQYLANGGFLFAEACCNSKVFDRQFRKVVKRLTGSALAPLKKDHAVWTASGKFRLSPTDCPLEGVSKGGRTLVVYSPKALAGYWENNDFTSEKGKKAFQIAASVIAHATGKKLPPPRP